MQFLRTLSVLVLLLTGNIGVAFTSFQDIDHLQESGISFDYAEDGQDLSYSNLTAPYAFQFGKNFISYHLRFDLESDHTSAKAKNYLLLSRFIDPSLDIPEIIFPFHFFL